MQSLFIDTDHDHVFVGSTQSHLSACAKPLA
nr:MAG TPA: hypothetical protein [Caudoviricetes sp.]DAN61413.1 MAG TPA: hypothetical protein [Caudoviricetes sp.]